MLTWSTRSPKDRTRKPVLLQLSIWFVLLSACLARVSAQGSDRTIAQFAHTTWGPKEGAPSVVTALAQSPDGYLWLGSPDGLYLFDGVAFERYQPKSGGPFPSQYVVSLLALSNGDLWIGFTYGISLLRNGHVTNYTARDGIAEGWKYLAHDREGTIWASTNRGLLRLENNRWKEVGKDWNFPGKSPRAIFLDRQGTLWVATEDTLVFLPSGARRFQLTGIRVGQVGQIAQAAAGKLWMAEATRSVRPIPLADKRQPPDETEIQVGSGGILFDRDGALWITSLGDGLRRSPSPELLRGRIKEFSTAVESFTAKDGLSNNVVRPILQDREGNIWVGTNSGLDRFRKTNLVPLVLSLNPQEAVFAAGDAGDIWIKSTTSMFRVQGGRADRGHLLPSQPIYAYRDPAGAIWWICIDAIYRYNAGNYTRIALPPSFPKPYLESEIAATADGFGAFWLAALREGLFYRKKGRWQRLETAPQFAMMSPRTAFTDWMGRAWFGYGGGTIILLDQGNIQRVFRAEDSLVRGVRAIDGRGRHIWIGGELGLAFFDGKDFRRIIPADAEAFGLVMGVEETSDGSVWLAESRGVIQVPASEVQQARENSSYRVKYRVFDSFDGLPGAFADAQTTSKVVIHGTDGKLWFFTSNGVAWIDPAGIFTNALPPPVLIQSVKANGRQPGSLTDLVLPPRTTNLQIGYTALSLAVPERVRFRYRLEGVEKDWQDAGTRREAFYNRLGPGEYHFRVIACNNDGVWNEEGAHLDFKIAPAWYQTLWFKSVVGITLLATCFFAYRLRVRQIAVSIGVRFDERLAERTRMARELHDTFLQTVQGSKMIVEDALQQGADGDRMRQALEKVFVWLTQAVGEGRAALHALRTSTMERNRISEALQRAAEDPQIPSSMTVSMTTVGDPHDLHPIVRDEIYRIAFEAIHNAALHSKASRLQIELRYANDVSVRVSDNGVGMDPAVADHGKDGHFGLQGMRERATRIHGKLSIRSSVGSGTEVTVSVPGTIVYRTTPQGLLQRIRDLLRRLVR